MFDRSLSERPGLSVADRTDTQQQVSNLFLVFLSARFSPGGTDCDNDASIAHPQY